MPSLIFDPLLELALRNAQEQLQALANGEIFLDAFVQSFGNHFNLETVSNLRQQWAEGEFADLPSIEVRSASELDGANGSFSPDTGQIYISSKFLRENESNPRAVITVLMEEIGHYVDSRINMVDSPGDEGAIFSALVQQGKLSKDDLSRLKAENDHGIIHLNEKAISVEKNDINVTELINGLDGLLIKLQGTVESQVFGNKLPLLENPLRDSFLTTLKETIKGKLQAIADPTTDKVKEALQAALNESGLQQGNIRVAQDGSFVLSLGKSVRQNSSLDANLGFQDLGFNFSGNAQVDLGYNLTLKFGTDAAGRFYVDTASADEVSLTLDTSLPGFSSKTNIGPLELSFTDSNSRAKGSFAINLTDNGDNRITSTELTSATASTALTGALEGGKFLDVNLKLAASGSVGSFQLPGLETTFDVDWTPSQSGISPDQLFTSGAAPIVAFRDITLNSGSFKGFTQPVLDTVNKVLDPVRPLLKVLSQDIDLGVAKFKLLDIAKALGYIDKDDQAFIDSVLKFVDVTGKIDNLIGQNPGGIRLGEITFANQDVRTGGLSSFNPTSQSTVSTGDLGAGLEFPILTKLTETFNLLTGKPANLVTYDLPVLQFTADYSQYFPSPIPVVGIEVRGLFSAAADLDFGFDTSGFFINDLDKNGKDKPEFTLGAGLEAYGALNAGIASAGVGGGLYANVNFNFNNQLVDAQGKLRFTNPNITSPLCLFDTSGSFTAGINAFARIGYGWFSRTERFESPRLTLLSFDVPAKCPPGGGVALNPVLASQSGNTIGLNSGRSAVKQIGNAKGISDGNSGDGGDGDGTNTGQDPNNTFGEATDLGLVPFIDPNNALISPNNISATPPKTRTNRIGFNEAFGRDVEDYYRLTLNQPGDLSVSISSLSQDAELEIYDNNNELIGSSTRGGTETETVHLTELAAGTYYARVIPYDDDDQEGTISQTNYKLAAIASPTIGSFASPAQGAFTDDLRRSFADSAFLSDNGVLTEEPVRGSFDTNDDPAVNDYYQFTLGEGTTAVEILVTDYSFIGEADFQVFNSAFERIAQSTVKEAGTDSLILGNLRPGDTYYVHVYPEEPTINTGYNITVRPTRGGVPEVSTESQFSLSSAESTDQSKTQPLSITNTAASIVQPDPGFLLLSAPVAEPGNTKETAAAVGVITNITPVNKTLTGTGDNDYYRFTVNQNSDFSLLLDFSLGLPSSSLTKDQFESQIPTVKLLDASGVEIATGSTILQQVPSPTTKQRQTQQSLSLNLQAGDYYVQVSKPAGQSSDIPYSLSLANATDLGTISNIFSYKGDLGGVGGSQEKLYRFTVNTSNSFGLSLGKADIDSESQTLKGLNSLSADLDVELLKSDGTTVLQSSASGNSAESIEIDDLKPGTYYIRLKTKNQDQQKTDYDLILASLNQDEYFRIEQTGEKIFVSREQYGNPLPTGTSPYRQEFASATTITASGDKGDDIFEVVNTVSARMELNGDDGNDQIQGGTNDDVLTGGEGQDFIQGNAGNDILKGGNGDDLIEGSAGADSLYGGDEQTDNGFDTAIYTNSDAGVNVSLVSNTASGGHADGDSLSGIENLQGSNNFGDTLIGNDQQNILDGSGGNDILSGNGSDDVLIGGTGADQLNGGTGNDTASYFNSLQGVNVNLATSSAIGGDAAGDSFTSIENLDGSEGNDTLTGRSDDNRLSGNAGADTLDGGAGNDILIGGTGKSYASESDRALGKGTEFADILLGGEGNDLLVAGGAAKIPEFAEPVSFGGGGADTLRGSTGDDIYVIDPDTNGGSQIQDDDGIDSIAFVALKADFTSEAIQLDGSALTPDKIGFGKIGSTLIVDLDKDGLANPDKDLSVLNFFNASGFGKGTGFIESISGTTGISIFDSVSGETGIAPARINFKRGKRGIKRKGTNGKDNLKGTNKNDVLKGLGRNDRLDGKGGNDRLDGGNGNDRIKGGKGNDELKGGKGNDRLLGQAGNDVLIGGIGKDILTGGTGKDLFSFNQLTEAGDRITDFDVVNDLSDLRGIFAKAEFGGTTPFARLSQFVQTVQIGENTEVRIDADGSGNGTSFQTLLTLQNVQANTVTSRNFVIV